MPQNINNQRVKKTLCKQWEIHLKENPSGLTRHQSFITKAEDPRLWDTCKGNNTTKGIYVKE